MRTMKIALFAAVLALGACKKKDDKAAEGAKTTEPAKADDKKADTTAPTPTAAPTAAPAGGASDEAMEAKGMELMGKMADMFAGDAKDCAKLATDIKAFITDNKATFEELKAYDAKQTPEQKKMWDEKHKADTEAAMKKMEPAMTACGSNADVQAAMKDFPLN